MRIDTSGDKSWRSDLYERTAENLGENTKVGGIDAACEEINLLLQRLEDAADHPDMTPELADALSTNRITVVHDVETGLDVRDRDD